MFLLLEVVAFMFLVNNREYPKSHLLSTANAIVAHHSERIHSMAAYMHLRRINEELVSENIRLQNEIVSLNNRLETTHEQDTYQYAHLDYSFQSAKVVQVTTNRRDNYLTINKGLRDSVYQGMGVCCKDGIVGIVTTVGERFSLVIPIINVKSHISCRFVKNDYFTSLAWLGNDIHHVLVTDVATHVNVMEGDTLVTSGLTSVFPANLPVAVVDQVSVKEGDSYYVVRARILTDYRRLNYIQLIRNNAHQELDSLSNANTY